MEGIQVLCSSSSSRHRHHLLPSRRHDATTAQLPVVRFPHYSRGGGGGGLMMIRLTTTTTRSSNHLGRKAAAATASWRCFNSKGVSPELEEREPHGEEEVDGGGEEEEGLMDKLMMEGKWCSKEERRGAGVAELLECLEREAIMGDDNGRLPTDYNRRAQIFDRSSRVFQPRKPDTSP